MKPIFFAAALFALLSACTMPSFPIDADPIEITTETPDHFELPARFAVVRTVYGQTHAPREDEAALWENLAERYQNMGEFSVLVTAEGQYLGRDHEALVNAARAQRYNYILLVAISPATGSANISVLDVGSGGVMATAQAHSPESGRRGFFGGRIYNPRRLAYVTYRIANNSLPVVEQVLQGIIARQ
jgi:hypothetical protein